MNITYLSAQLEEVPGDDEPLAVVHLGAAPSGRLLPLAALLLLDWLSLHRGRLGLAGDTAVSTRLAWTVQFVIQNVDLESILCRAANNPLV